jgi:G3E family GTPase
VISMDNGCVCCTVRGDFIHSFYMHTLSCVWVSVYIVS